MKRIIRTAETVSVGTELLLGDTVNTDAACIAKALAMLGIHQYRQTAVGDNRERLEEAVREALSRADLLILTGGLGPTYDDITKETVAAILKRPLLMNADSLARLEDFFRRVGRRMTDNNRKQALMPTGAVVFPNRNGTADGCAVDCPETGKTVILLPGPPSELEPMVREQVLPFLSGYTDRVLVSKNINICGMGESEVEALLHDRMAKAKNPTEAPYCAEGEVRIRVTASSSSRAEAEALCEKSVKEILETPVGRFVYGVDTTPERAVVEGLAASHLTLFTAESCTGGLVAKVVTDVPGASRVLKGGVVSYTNEIKRRLLGVSEETLEKETAVSSACATEMAEGARRISGADLGVATTGYADGGEGVPAGCAGLVFIALADENGTQVKELHLTGTRAAVREKAVKQLFRMILDSLMSRKENQ